MDLVCNSLQMVSILFCLIALKLPTAGWFSLYHLFILYNNLAVIEVNYFFFFHVLRKANISCPCPECTSVSSKQNAIKIVQVKPGYLSVVATLKTADTIHCILVCEPNYLLAAEESKRLHLWVMSSSWRWTFSKNLLALIVPLAFSNTFLFLILIFTLFLTISKDFLLKHNKLLLNSATYSNIWPVYIFYL